MNGPQDRLTEICDLNFCWLYRLCKTSNKCKMSETKSHVERRLNLWKTDNVGSLLNETRAIQNDKKHKQQKKN